MDKETELNPSYFNRDLSWLDFNERVLEEGLRKDKPLFERFRFLAIVVANFDEFFMVRVAALKRARRAGLSGDPSGLSPAEQLEGVFQKASSIIRRLYDCLMGDIFPALAAGGLELVRPDSYTVPKWISWNRSLSGRFTRSLRPCVSRRTNRCPFSKAVA